MNTLNKEIIKSKWEELVILMFTFPDLLTYYFAHSVLV
jgi:hypothetical protein